MKRFVFGVGASLIVGLLSATGAFASSLDYAKSIGQIDMGDTVNYVVEATSDGGYVAGGQTIQCFKGGNGSQATTESFVGGLKPALLSNNRYISGNIGEVVPMSECEEAYANSSAPNPSKSVNAENGNKVDAPIVRQSASIRLAEIEGPHFTIDDFCESDSPKSGLDVSAILGPVSVRLADYDPGAAYNVRCVDYIAKFKQDGAQEWLNVILDSSKPVAVGETSSDYRLLTRRGSLYTFTKADGAENLASQIETSYVYDAIINNDGTTTTYDSNNGVAVYAPSGSLKKSLGDSTATTNDDYYANSMSIAKPLVRTGDSIIVFDYHEEKDDDDNWSGSTIIMKVSNDLNTVTPIMIISNEDVDEAGIDDIQILSADQNGNVLILLDVYDETTDEDSYYLASINKEGDLIEIKEVDEVASLSQTTRVFDDFTIFDAENKKIMRLAPNLEVTDSIATAEGEVINDMVLLKDNSLAGVGRSTASTDNYTVDGNMNGIHIRLAAKGGSNGGTVNPNTDDNSAIFAISGSVAVIVIAGVAALISKRR